MSPDPVTQERVYEGIMAEYRAAAFRPGFRLDLTAMADRFRASATPVREAIHRLTGERLVETHPDGGFRIVSLDGLSLASLYAWNDQHLLSALHVTPDRALLNAIAPYRGIGVSDDPAYQANLVSSLFRALGVATGNATYAEQVEAASNRLFYARLAESALFPDAKREITSLTKGNGKDVQKRLRRRILAYHRRRVEYATQIASLMQMVEAPRNH